MADEIRIHKGVIGLALGLFVVLAAAAYVVNAAPQGSDGGPQAQLAREGAGPQAQVQADAQPPGKGGCGCGGGGAACGAGIQALSPDPSKAVLLNTTGAPAQGDVQEIYIKARNDGTYDKQEVTVKAGSPVRLHFTADPDAGCGRQMVIYGMNIKAASTNGAEDVVDFMPQKAGTYEYNCGMRMWKPGKLVVV